MSSRPMRLPVSLGSPLAGVGRVAIAVLAYVGGVGLMLASFFGVVRREGVLSRAFWSDVSAELGWMFAMGLPLTALSHVGLGSFLAMQAYYGGTFADGTGAVVGVGLFRNIAPQMAGFVLAGLLAARVTTELRARSRDSNHEPAPRPGFLERTADGRHPEPSPVKRPAPVDRMIAVRIFAATVAGPVLGLWGATVGTVVGWQVGKSLVGVSTHSFFMWFWDMLWESDVTGLLFKGLLFGMVSSLLACHEGLRRPDDEPPGHLAASACRAACLAFLAILFINSGWFLVMYHAGPAFGPTLLTPPQS